MDGISVDLCTQWTVQKMFFEHLRIQNGRRMKANCGVLHGCLCPDLVKKVLLAELRLVHDAIIDFITELFIFDGIVPSVPKRTFDLIWLLCTWRSRGPQFFCFLCHWVVSSGFARMYCIVKYSGQFFDWKFRSHALFITILLELLCL